MRVKGSHKRWASWWSAQQMSQAYIEALAEAAKRRIGPHEGRKGVGRREMSYGDFDIAMPAQNGTVKE